MMETRTSTPLSHTYNVPVHNRFSEFQQQWANCDQTPIGQNGQPGSHNTRANRPFSLLNSDDKLLRIFQQLGKYDDIYSNLQNLSSNLTRTTSQLDQVERRLNLHLEFTKLQLYHSIDDNARSRRNNIIFYGLADMRNENCLEVLTEFLSDWLDIDLERTHIQRVHRLGSLGRTVRG
jgi:hypothetical protein